MVDSRDDPRVQVADLLAGVPRRLPEIVDDLPLQPFLSPTSLRDPPRGSDRRSLERDPPLAATSPAAYRR
jgi:hypothetical protein